MADLKISQLPSTTIPLSADIIPIVTGGVTKKITFANLTSGIGGGTVTSVSWTTSQGVSASISNATTTPNITITLGALTGVTSINGLVITANTGTITTGSWAASVIGAAFGGTGVANNAASTLTISGSFASTFTVTGAFNYTFPTATSKLLAASLGISGGTILIGGTGTTDDLVFRTTSGVGTTGADFIWQGGNNGATELMRLLNGGQLGLGMSPSKTIDITASTPEIALHRSVNTNTSIIYFYTGASTFEAFFGISRNSGTGIFTGAGADSFCIASAGKQVHLGDSTADRIAMTIVPTTGNIIIGGGTTITATAKLQLGAGTATANTAPLKLTTGTSLTSPEAGAFEFTTDNLFFTGTTGTTRKTISDYSYRGITALRTLDGSDELVNCTSGTFTVTLPTAVGYTKQYTIKNIGTGVITLATTSSQTIDGYASGILVLNQYDSYRLRSDGANWIIIY